MTHDIEESIAAFSLKSSRIELEKTTSYKGFFGGGGVRRWSLFSDNFTPPAIAIFQIHKCILTNKN